MTLQAATQTVSTRPAPRRRTGAGPLATLAGRRGHRAEEPGQTCIVRLSCADDDAQGQIAGSALGLRARPPDSRGRGLGRPRGQGLRSAAPVRGVPAHAAVELRHGHRPEPLPGAVPRRDQDRRLPDGAAAQGAPSAARQPLHRRRHGPRQDDRGRSHRPRAAPAQEGQDHRGRDAAVGPRAVEGRARGALRPRVRDSSTAPI